MFQTDRVFLFHSHFSTFPPPFSPLSLNVSSTHTHKTDIKQISHTTRPTLPYHNKHEPFAVLLCWLLCAVWRRTPHGSVWRRGPDLNQKQSFVIVSRPLWRPSEVVRGCGGGSQLTFVAGTTTSPHITQPPMFPTCHKTGGCIPVPPRGARTQPQ